MRPIFPVKKIQMFLFLLQHYFVATSVVQATVCKKSKRTFDAHYRHVHESPDILNRFFTIPCARVAVSTLSGPGILKELALATVTGIGSITETNVYQVSKRVIP